MTQIINHSSVFRVVMNDGCTNIIILHLDNVELISELTKVNKQYFYFQGDTKEQTNHSKTENGNGTKTYTKTVNPTILVKLGLLIDKNRRYLNYAFLVILNIAVVVHYSFATNHYVTEGNFS